MSPAEFKTAREALGMSAEEVAARMGVTRKTIYGLESPARTLPVPERHVEFLRGLQKEFDAAVRRGARKGGAVLRYADEEAFQKAYRTGLPFSTQGAILAEVARATGAQITYA